MSGVTRLVFLTNQIAFDPNMSTPVGRKLVRQKFVPRNEQIVLSAMMKSMEVMIRLCAILNPGMFIDSDGRHATIFIVLCEMVERRLAFDLETFEQLATGRKYGGREYIKALVDAFPEGQSNLDHHVEQMRVDTLKAGALKGPVQNLVDLCGDPTSGLADVRSAIQVLNTEFSGSATDGILRGEALREKYQRRLNSRIRESSFVSTGMPALDKYLTGGLSRPAISVWTGQTGMGKSTLAWNVADYAANKLELSVVYFSFEMTAEALLDAMACARTGLPLAKVIRYAHKMPRKEIKAIRNAVRDITRNGKLAIRERRIRLRDLPGVLADVRPQLAIFDLWERMIPAPNNEAITEGLGEMEDLTKEYDFHAFILQQQRRVSEKVPHQRPTLGGLKNSGGYAEFADLVGGLYREKWFRPETPKDVLEIQIMKQKRGEGGAFACVEFDAAHGRVGGEVRGWLEDQSRFL